MTDRTRRSSSHAYYVCYNQVSYVVACEHALRTNPSRATLFIDRTRVAMQPRYAYALAHRQLGHWYVMFACIRSLLQPITLYVPHRRFGLMLRVLSRLAASLGLLDDGLDTLRERPKNIDVFSLADFSELLTFEDYECLASWTSGLPDIRVCPLSKLVTDFRPKLSVNGARALVVQSPGVDLASAASGFGMTPEEVLVILHSNPNKRGDAPPKYQSRGARDCCIEKTVLSFEGPVLTGETMVTVVALYLRQRAELVVELSTSQYDNLKCLHSRFASDRVRLTVRADTP